MEENENEEQEQQQKLLETLENLTIKENWDKFLSTLERYADWPQIRQPLLTCISAAKTAPPETSSSSTSPPPPPLQILIPFCGISGLSEHLYDAGFHCITNIDFIKVVISEMLRRNVRLRPEMKWRVMDMTEMKFVDETFDVVLDKGGLDALMEPLFGPEFGNEYLVEVKRVLQKGGKFICLTLGESHVLGILFPEFRYGWRVSVHALPLKPNKPSQLTFMVIAEKESSSMLHMIPPSFDPNSLPSEGGQVCGLLQALDTENRVRREFSYCSDEWYTLEELKQGAKGDLGHYRPGLRIQLIMGEDEHSDFVYRAVLLDCRQRSDSDPFLHDFGVFLVPKTRGHEWIFSSEEGQWAFVEGAMVARLIMVLLNSSHTEVSMKKIQLDLLPLIKHLEPWKYSLRAEMGSDLLRCWVFDDGIKECKLVHQVASPLTGPIIVEEVVPEKVDDDFLCPSKDLLFRCLSFQKSQNSNRSQALLKREESLKVAGIKEQKNTHSSKSKKKGNRRRNESHASQTDDIHDSSHGLKVDHGYLASAYHVGIISGFVLISSYLERMASTGQSVKATIIGLGAGLLPMFLHGCLPFVHITVVELDPVVRDLARDFFDFKEDERLKVHIADGILFVREAVKSKVAAEMNARCENEEAGSSVTPSIYCESSSEPIEVCEGSNRVDILIVDMDSFDPSSGLASPREPFVEESFLSTVKEFITEQGLFIMHLLSRSPAVKASVISRMKAVFLNFYILETKVHDHEVIFALNTKVATDINGHEASQKLKKLLKLNNPITRRLILDGINNIIKIRK